MAGLDEGAQIGMWAMDRAGRLRQAREEQKATREDQMLRRALEDRRVKALETDVESRAQGARIEFEAGIKDAQDLKISQDAYDEFNQWRQGIDLSEEGIAERYGQQLWRLIPKIARNKNIYQAAQSLIEADRAAMGAGWHETNKMMMDGLRNKIYQYHLEAEAREIFSRIQRNEIDQNQGIAEITAKVRQAELAAQQQKVEDVRQTAEARAEGTAAGTAAGGGAKPTIKVTYRDPDTGENVAEDLTQEQFEARRQKRLEEKKHKALAPKVLKLTKEFAEHRKFADTDPKAGWSGIGLGYDRRERMTEIEKELRDLGYDVEGNRLKGGTGKEINVGRFIGVPAP